MASLGQSLKTERELRGITLKEIADSTRISLRFLKALEEDRIDMMPGKFFVRAILRSYAKAIGLDENQVLNKYQEMLQMDDYEVDKTPRTPAGPPALPQRKRLLFFAVPVLVVLAGLIIVFLFFSSLGKKPRPQDKKAEQIAASQPAQPAPTLLEPSPASEQATGQNQGLDLAISFLEETWIQVVADGNFVWDGIKNRGETLKVKAATELKLNVGNAGGLTFTINGKAAKPLGPRGAVRKDIKITLTNFGEFLQADKPGEG